MRLETCTRTGVFVVVVGFCLFVGAVHLSPKTAGVLVIGCAQDGKGALSSQTLSWSHFNLDETFLFSHLIILWREGGGGGEQKLFFAVSFVTIKFAVLV